MSGTLRVSAGPVVRCRPWLGVPIAVLAAVAAVGGCSSSDRRPERVEKPLVIRDVPDVLRGTIGSETTLNGVEPVLISGFGIVVGLNGTGGNGGLDPAVQATMERELSRGGISRAPDGDLGVPGVSPTEFLRSKNVAVVIVEAAVPPGAPKSTSFDVRVRALPNSEVTSLEGGTLWTTDLRVGPATVFEGYKTHLLGLARGPIFINPFAEPNRAGDAVTRTVGRVIGGGVLTNPLRIEMALDNESHSRARSIMNAINTRFPQGRYDEGPIASGRDGASLAIRVPFDYRDDPAEFIRLLQYTRIDQQLTQEWACRYAEELRRRPELASSLVWCLRALGDQAIRSGCLHPLYDSPEIGPRMAALEVGAKLGDSRVVPFLTELAKSGAPAVRSSAISLMGDMQTNPQVGLVLRTLLDSPELDVRITAYEALAKRGDPAIERRAVGNDPGRPRFYLDLVPSSEPLIYVTQQGKPRIVIFSGRNKSGEREVLRLNKPLMVSAWSERFMLVAESEADPVRLFYADARVRGGGEGNRPTRMQAPDKLVELVYMLAQQTTPENPAPGLNMTFGEVVGALYEIQKQRGVLAMFATETDRLGAAVFQASQSTVIAERPITTSGEAAPQKIVTYEPNRPETAGSGTPPPTDAARTYVVPLSPPAKSGG